MENFAFQTSELNGELNRIISEQVLLAGEQLQTVASCQMEGIHEARKCFKRLRACYRLLKSSDKSTFRQGNQFFRDLSAKLSAVRDSQVMVQTLSLLRLDNPGLVGNPLLNELERRLALQQQEAVVQARVQALLVSDLLKKFLRQFNQTELSSIEAGSLLRDIAKNYAVVRRGWKQARRSGDDDDYHHWRKHAKYYWYQIRLISILCPPPKNMLNSLDQLCDLLGDYHDLSVLRGRCVTMQSEAGAVLEAIDERRRVLSRAAGNLAGSLFKRSAGRYEDWLTRRWNKATA